MFITKEEYIDMASVQLQYDQVSGDADSKFNIANEAVTAMVVDLAGLADPGNDTSGVNGQVKMCAAWIISFILFTPAALPSVTAEQYAENRGKYDEAKAILTNMGKYYDGDARTKGYAFNDLIDF